MIAGKQVEPVEVCAGLLAYKLMELDGRGRLDFVL